MRGCGQSHHRAAGVSRELLGRQLCKSGLKETEALVNGYQHERSLADKLHGAKIAPAGAKQGNLKSADVVVASQQDSRYARFHWQHWTAWS